MSVPSKGEAARAEGRRLELEDVLALLAQQIENAGLMVARSPEFADYARDRQRQLEVLADDLKGGRHHGMAQVRADLKALASAEGGRD